VLAGDELSQSGIFQVGQTKLAGFVRSLRHSQHTIARATPILLASPKNSDSHFAAAELQACSSAFSGELSRLVRGANSPA